VTNSIGREGGGLVISITGNSPAQLAKEAKLTAAKLQKETIVTCGATLFFGTACDPSEIFKLPSFLL